MKTKDIVECPKCGYDVIRGQEEYCYNCAKNGENNV